MEKRPAGFCSSALGRALASFLFILLASIAAAAQNPNSGPPNNPNAPENQDAFNKRDMRDREASLRTRIYKETDVGSTRERRLALKQIAEDYERVQVVNNELLRALTSGAEFDYKRLAELTGEIRKRADRLKLNLALPLPEETQKERAPQKGATPTPDAAPVKDSLVALDQLILSFVTNPIFRSKTLAVDAQLAAKASRDLESIINLSAHIKRAADKLSKEASAKKKEQKPEQAN